MYNPIITYDDYAGGFIHMRDGANTQYATGTSFLFTVYSDLLAKHKQKIKCGNKEFDSSHILDFAKKQVSTHTLFIPTTHILILYYQTNLEARKMKLISNFYITNIQRRNSRYTSIF